MADIILAGDISGSVTIAAPAIAGTTVITLPATTGTLLASGGALGTPSSGTLTSCTGLPMTTGVTGTLPVANGGTGVTTSTGSGANVLGTSPTLTTPVINGFTGDTSVINIGSGQVYKDASGNVGIGTSTTTNAKLTVNGLTAKVGDSISTGIYAMGDTNVTASYVGMYRGTAASISSGNWLNLGGYDGIAFTTGAAAIGSQTERMRIDSSGNLFIGTTTNPVSNATAIINAVVSSGDGFNLKHTVNGNNMFNLWQTGTTTYTAIGFSKGGSQTVIGTISVSTSAVAYNTTSDYRLKENIVPMVGALETVTKLKPVTYKWKVDGSDGQGFIAHELAAVVPGCVTGEKDATREEEYEVTPAVPAVVDAEGVETTPAVQAVKGTRTVPSYQGVDTSFLVATLTAAIQELKAIIDTQATRITALEAK